MKEKQPANPKKSEARRNRMNIQPLALAAEISGYCDIGMKREALRLARKVFAKRRISPEEFFEAIRAIGVHSDFQRLKPQIEAAYDRQSRRFKSWARAGMLYMYATLGDWETAAQFVSVQHASSAGEMFFSMEVLLALDKLEDAEHLAAKCQKAFRFMKDPSDQSFLIETLAPFLARTHRWDEAIAIWQQAPLDQPFRRDALSGIVKIHLGHAWEAAERGLQLLSELRQKPSIEDSITLPNNDVGLTRSAETQLLKFKRGIEKLLPEEARKELGVDVPAGPTCAT
jgi:tetratricopeptide (TPR) repeat protein